LEFGVSLAAWRRDPLDAGVPLDSADEERNVSVLRSQFLKQCQFVRVAADHLSLMHCDIHAIEVRATEQVLSQGLEEFRIWSQLGERVRDAFAGMARSESRRAGGHDG
jgi:hypothetical protein